MESNQAQNQDACDQKADASWSDQAQLNLGQSLLFNYMADFTSTRNWDPSVVDAQLTSDAPIQLGSEFLIDLKMGFTVVQLNYKIVEFTPPSLVVLKCTTKDYTLTDRITISPNQANEHQSILEYKVTLNYHNSNAAKAKIGQFALNRFASKAFDNLKKLAFEDIGRTQHYPTVLDKVLVPGLYQFTRFGFFKNKKNFHPLPVNRRGDKVVITGCTSGIGKEIAVELARAGAEIIMVNRTASKARAFASELDNRFKATVHSYIADLIDIQQTYQTALQIQKDFPDIQCLINNAGELLQERKETPDGLEHNFAILLLAPFIITQVLLPSLMASKPSDSYGKVINMCSGGLYAQALHLEDLQYKQGDFDGSKAYARAKRGLLDASAYMSREYNDKQVRFFSMHPGWANTPGVEKSLAAFYKATQKVLRTPFQGADTAVWLALNKAPLESGVFWLDRQVHTDSIFPNTKTSNDDQARLYKSLSALMTQHTAAQQAHSQEVHQTGSPAPSELDSSSDKDKRQAS